MASLETAYLAVGHPVVVQVRTGSESFPTDLALEERGREKKRQETHKDESER